MHDNPTNYLLEEVRKLLTYYQSMGIKHYPRSKAIDTFLQYQKQPPNKGEKQVFPATSSDTQQKNSALQNEQSHAGISISIEDVRTEIDGCTRCQLHVNRNTIVFGQGGVKNVSLFVVGESPGEEDDQSGKTCSGEPGALLAKMLGAINLSREQTFITTLVKCRPRKGRPPESDEINSCLPFLQRQIEATSPYIICAMGAVATQTLLKTEESFFKLRGKFHDFYTSSGRHILLMPTFLPSFLIKNPEMKRGSWHDLQLIARQLQIKK